MCIIVSGLSPDPFTRFPKSIGKGFLARENFGILRVGLTIWSMSLGESFREYGTAIDEHLFEKGYQFQTFTKRPDIRIAIGFEPPRQVPMGDWTHRFTQEDLVQIFVGETRVLSYNSYKNKSTPYSLSGGYTLEWAKEGRRRNPEKFEIVK
jgi:hypothetical protein